MLMINWHGIFQTKPTHYVTTPPRIHIQINALLACSIFPIPKGEGIEILAADLFYMEEILIKSQHVGAWCNTWRTYWTRVNILANTWGACWTRGSILANTWGAWCNTWGFFNLFMPHKLVISSPPLGIEPSSLFWNVLSSGCASSMEACSGGACEFHG
ncbi:hypothetical protein Ahy_A06g026171 isoform D [Arachis hypogaea]|uniref:Uncharacterized protein n=1 Tax=Arachis hypogaea TaxID=3818 RepID=A0A445CJN2_ARAHY|nr:hypothetical protein Ahy_A06g026171 isoform D [Arachis hypogaea]